MFALKTVRTAFTVAASLMLSSQALVAQATPSAAEVIAKYVAAIGGKDAISKMTSYKQIGTMELPGAGLTADMEMAAAAPNKVSTKMVLGGMGEVLTGTDGQNAWSVNPMQGPRIVEGKEKDQMLEQADFYSMLYDANRYTSIANEGAVDFAGEKTWKLKFVRKGTGTESWIYFSVASGLEVGRESTVTSEMGSIQTSTVVSDYKAFGGIKFATKAQTTMGPQTMIMTIKDVQLNAPVDVSVPAAVVPLIKK
jgi:hypothetical protein